MNPLNITAASDLTLIVSHKRDFVSLYNWTMGKSITVSINDAGFVPPAPIIVDESIENIFLNFEIQPDQTVTVTDGTTTVFHTVRDFAITQVDPINDTISGATDDLTSEIALLFLSEPMTCNRTTTANPDGTWSVDVSVAGAGEEVCDIRPGSYGEIRQQDGNGHATMDDFDVPTLLVASPNSRTNYSSNSLISVYNWSMGESIIISIDDAGFVPPDPIVVDQSIENISLDFNIQPGQTVTVTDGITTVFHTVRDFVVTQVDPINDTISGTTDDLTSEIGLIFLSEPLRPNPCNRTTTANPDGTWSVDVSVAGAGEEVCDIRSGSYGEFRQQDENGHATVDGFDVLPVINAIYESAYVDGYYWPSGYPVTLTLDDDSNPGNGILYQETQPVVPDTGDPSYGSVSFSLGKNTGKINLNRGQYVTLTNGDITKNTWVEDVRITDVDDVTDTILGTGPVNRSATIFINAVGGGGDMNITIGSDGNWVANFGFDIQGILGVSARIFDDDDDSTEEHYQIPNIYVDANSDAGDVFYYPLNSTVTVEVDDPSNGVGNVDYSTTVNVDQISELNWSLQNETEAHFDLSGLFDIQPGFIITASESNTPTKIHTVAGFTSFDVNTDMVAGKAEANARVDIQACDDSNCFNRHVQANASGIWTADFSKVGSEADEQDTFDVVPGTWMNLEQKDSDLDLSWYGQYIPDPNGSISGYVYQGDGVTPIPNMAIDLLATYETRETCSDTNGYFSFGSVPYGVGWRVSAVTTRRCVGQPEGYTREYWQNASLWDDAALIVLNGSVPNYDSIIFTLDTGETTSGVIGATGGTLSTSQNAVRLELPPAAVSEDITFTITDSGIDYQVATGEGDIRVFSSTTIGPEGTAFSTPATLTFNWPDENNDGVVDGSSIPEGKLSLSKDGIVIAGPCYTDTACDLTANTITVQVSSLSFFVLGLIDQVPTDISLSASSVNENLPVGSSVGTFSTTDPDTGDTFTYSFCGGTDDASFSITGNTLKTATIFDYETKGSYGICIRSTDSGSLSFDKNFTVNITNVPDTQTFTDVQMDYWSWSYIERLYGSGITGGCGTNPLNYCPEATVTRAQMAIFLEKGMHYPAVFTPVNVAPTFSDTVNHWAEDWIEALKNDSITSGCGTGLYCPEAPVTRAQMAVFLLKAKYGSTYNPPAVGASTGFGDIPTNHWAAAWIKQLVAESVTSGCGSGNYCPDTPVTRAQMAVFLVKTFGLP